MIPNDASKHNLEQNLGLFFPDVIYPVSDRDLKQCDKYKHDEKLLRSKRQMVHQREVPLHAVKQIFYEFDFDQSGYLNRNELYHAVNRLYLIWGFRPINREEVVPILNRFDLNGDRQIDLNEFFKFVSVMNEAASKNH